MAGFVVGMFGSKSPDEGKAFSTYVLLKDWKFFGPAWFYGFGYIFIVKPINGFYSQPDEQPKVDPTKQSQDQPKVDPTKQSQDQPVDKPITKKDWSTSPEAQKKEEPRTKTQTRQTQTRRRVDPNTGVMPNNNKQTQQTPQQGDNFFGPEEKEDPLIAKYKDFDIRNSDNMIEKRVGDLFANSNMRVYYDRSKKIIVVKKLEPVGNPMAPQGFSLKDAGPGGSLIRIIPQNDQPSGLFKALMQAYELTHNSQPMPRAVLDNMWSGRAKNNGQQIEFSDDVVILNRPLYRGENYKTDFADKFVVHQPGPYDPNTGLIDKRQSNVGSYQGQSYTDKATGKRVYYPTARGFTGSN